MCAARPTGDLFVCRNAGNQAAEDVVASLDYGVHHLGIKVVVVLGHQYCGAVKAARLPIETITKERPRLSRFLVNIHHQLDSCKPCLDEITNSGARDREAVIINAQNQVNAILEDDMLAKMVANDELIVIPAFYELTSGRVEFVKFEE